MVEHAEKYEYIYPGPSKNYDYSWDVLRFPVIILWRSMLKSMNASIQEHLKSMIIAETCFNLTDYPMAAHAEKYECIHPGPSKNYDYRWDVLQFPMIILWAMAEHALEYEYIHPGPSKNYDYSWDVLQFPVIILWRRVLKSLNTSIQDHLKSKIIAGACFKFHWFSSGRACWEVWIHPSRTI